MVIPGHIHGGLERNPLARVRIGDLMAVDEAPANAELTGWRPGDARPDRESMLRVDQAGEYGATRIYAGQLAVMGDRHPASRLIARMAAGVADDVENDADFGDLLIDDDAAPSRRTAGA